MGLELYKLHSAFMRNVQMIKAFYCKRKTTREFSVWWYDWNSNYLHKLLLWIIINWWRTHSCQQELNVLHSII